MNNLLDTNLLLFKLRRDTRWDAAQKTYQLDKSNNLISLTADGDFDHLDKEFLSLDKIVL